MSGPKSDFLREAQARGYIHQVTDTAALDAKLKAGPVAAYIGFDCTADSLHVGHLVSIMMLRLFQRLGRTVRTVEDGTSTAYVRLRADRRRRRAA